MTSDPHATSHRVPNPGGASHAAPDSTQGAVAPESPHNNATANRVEPWLDDGDLTLYHGDALEVLRGLPAGIAQTCVTSPPYWGLRDYGTGQWTGGDETCDHRIDPRPYQHGEGRQGNAYGTPPGGNASRTATYADTCPRCGARRVDSQLGLEATPTLYVENMVALFREVRRVLRDDGTLWLNLGDSYTAGMGSRNGLNGSGLKRNVTDEDERQRCLAENKVYRADPVRGLSTGLKPKDLVGIPWRVAFALQQDGWYLRSDIIWSKPNPMPESVTDRPTKAHEYLFLFSKQPRYFYDADAIREPQESADRSAFYDPDDMPDQKTPTWGIDGSQSLRDKGRAPRLLNPAGRNRRSVWTIPTQPFPEAHFATYPEELVRPCILAGTSEKGECVECGAPWVREVERESLNPWVDRKANGAAAGSKERGYNENHGAGMSHTLGSRSQTTGWAPSCSCLERAIHDDPTPEQAAAATRPQLVLDPFIGSGTTALVARKHGRRSIGIDLSAEYLQIAAKRTQQLSLLGGEA